MLPSGDLVAMAVATATLFIWLYFLLSRAESVPRLLFLFPLTGCLSYKAEARWPRRVFLLFHHHPHFN